MMSLHCLSNRPPWGVFSLNPPFRAFRRARGYMTGALRAAIACVAGGGTRKLIAIRL